MNEINLLRGISSISNKIIRVKYSEMVCTDNSFQFSELMTDSCFQVSVYFILYGFHSINPTHVSNCITETMQI